MGGSREVGKRGVSCWVGEGWEEMGEEGEGRKDEGGKKGTKEKK